jgi:hypothetical protein
MFDKPLPLNCQPFKESFFPKRMSLFEKLEHTGLFLPDDLTGREFAEAIMAQSR